MKQILMVVLFLVFSSVSFGQSLGKETLKGIKAVEVIIERIPYDSLGLSDQKVKTDIEIRLRKAGIKIAAPKSFGDDIASLYINLQVYPIKEAKGLYLYTNKVEIMQNVNLARNADIFSSAPTYAVTSSYGTTGEDNLRTLKEVVGDKVDIFINDYLEMNPKP